MCSAVRCQQCCRYWRLWIRPVTMGSYAVVLLIVLPVCIVQMNRADANPQAQAWFIGGVFVLLALPITLWEITQHLVHYTKPYLQKHIIRILWMVPIYALNSWMALLFPSSAIYLDSLRECYEAYVIYNFMIYLLNFLYASIDLESVLESKPQRKHLFPLCCLPPWQNGRTFIQRCKHGILQYTVVRPLTTIISVICELSGVYKESTFTLHNAFPYILVINNLSQFIAMYCLVLFYMANREELQPMNPVAKFICIKAVVFFSFFQGVIISILVWTGVISAAFTTQNDTEVKALASSLQDFLICIEMFIAAVAHLYAFSHIPYIDPEVEQVPCCVSCLSMLDLSDVQQDIRQHIRVVGSTVKRSVTGRSSQQDPPAVDERTRLLSPDSTGTDRSAEFSVAVAQPGKYSGLAECGGSDFNPPPDPNKMHSDNPTSSEKLVDV